MSDMQDQAAQDSLLKTAASESDSQASSAVQSLSHNSADQSMQPLLRSPCRTLLSNLRGERPNPQQHYKVGIYIRYFNQTKYADYLNYHVKQYQDTMALCPNWELIDFYIDEGATAPNMESAPEWCRLLQDCFRGKVNLIITQKVSNVSKKDYEITFLARILAALAKPVGIYFVSEDIFTMASCYQDTFTNSTLWSPIRSNTAFSDVSPSTTTIFQFLCTETLSSQPANITSCIAKSNPWNGCSSIIFSSTLSPRIRIRYSHEDL